MRRKKKKNHLHLGPHPDEKWLVSYSDMMTLLFGFFVLLYSFAIKNKGVSESIKQELKKISEKGFISSIKDEEINNFEPQKMKAIVIKMKNEVLALQEKNSALNAQLSMSQLEARQNALKRAPASLSNMAVSAKAEPQKLDKDKKLDAGIVSDSVVIVYIRWKNSNHDIDMVVTSPDKNVINSRNKKISESDTDEFVQDSKAGPGNEIFKTIRPKDGEYVFDISLYNSREDVSSSEVQLFVIKNGKEKIIETFTVKDDESQRSKEYRLNLKSIEL